MKVDPFRWVVLLACGAALTLPACGSDDDEGGGGDDGSAEALTHEELVAEATTACDAAQQRSEELNQELGGADVFAPESAPLLEDLAGVTRQLVADLEELEPPAADADGYEELIQFLADGTEKVEEMAAAVADGDREEAQSLQQELNESGEGIEATVSDLGLESCLAN